MTAAGESGTSHDPEFRRLRPAELGLLAVAVLLGLAISVLWAQPLSSSWPLIVAAVLGFGIAFLPKLLREIGIWVVGLGGGIACGVYQPAVAISWLLILPALYVAGLHVRAIRAQP